MMQSAAGMGDEQRNGGGGFGAPQSPTPVAPPVQKVTPQQLQAALADYKQRVAARHEARATGQADDNAMLAQPDQRPWYENAGRGLAAGLSTSGTSTMGMVGKLLTAGGADHVGPAITQAATDLDFKNRDFYDPHGTAGRIGSGTGELVGDAAQVMAPGAAIGDMAKAGGLVDRLSNGGRLARLAATGIRAFPGAAIHAGVQKLTDDPYQSTQHSVMGTVGRDVGTVYGAELLGAPFAAIGRKLGMIGSKAAPAIEAAAEAAPAAEAAAAPAAGAAAGAALDPDAGTPAIMKLREQVDALRQPLLEAQAGKDRAGAVGIAKRMQAIRAQIEELREGARSNLTAAMENGTSAPAPKVEAPAAAAPAAPAPAPAAEAAAPEDLAGKLQREMDDIKNSMSPQKRAKFEANAAADKPARDAERAQAVAQSKTPEFQKAMADHQEFVKAKVAEKQALRDARAKAPAETPTVAPDGPVAKPAKAKAPATPPAASKPAGGKPAARPGKASSAAESAPAKGAQGSKTSKSAPATKPAASPSPAAPAKLSPKEVKDYAQHEDYVNSVGKMFDGLPEGAAKERVRAKIQESKDILAKLDKKRKGS